VHLLLNLLQRFVIETIFLFNEMAIYLLLGFFLAGLIHAFLPSHRIEAAIGRPGMFSSLKAALFGVPMPLCSCGVVPTALSLKQSGATRGAVVSFLIATPQTGADSIAATWSMLGPVFAIFRPVVAFVTGTIGGFITDLGQKAEESTAAEDKLKADAPKTARERIHLTFSYGFGQLLGDIARWIVIGILIGGLIAALVPENFFHQFVGNPVLAYGLILLVSVPIYVCATGSIPVAMALIMKGLSPGAAFVFLMAGPATNTASLAVLWKTIGKKATLIYLTTIVAGAVLGGVVFDTWFSSAFTKSYSAVHHGSEWFEWVKTGGSVVLALLLIHSLWPHRKETAFEIPKPSAGLKITVLGMTCNHCKMNVENAAKSVPGVTAVEATPSENSLKIFGQADESAIRKAVETAGYTTT